MLEERAVKIREGHGPAADAVLLEVLGLKKYFAIRGGIFSSKRQTVKAVDGVDLRIYRGETLGLVGESGSGKTTLGRMVMRLEEPTAGRICFDGEDISQMSGEKLKSFRRSVQMIFQDPYSSLNPRKSAGRIIGEPLEIQRMLSGREKEERIAYLLDVVGLTREHMRRYPHEFSGGQRQRIGIARAVALNPRLIVADEPVSALDVSIQAQVLELLHRLQKDLGLTYLFISHDLSIVEKISDRVAVMYLGRIVEIAESRRIYRKPFHPYTKALFSSAPSLYPGEKRDRMILGGDIPSPVNPPAGCSFHPRCPSRMSVCEKVTPELISSEDGHCVACHLYRPSGKTGEPKERTLDP